MSDVSQRGAFKCVHACLLSSRRFGCPQTRRTDSQTFAPKDLQSLGTGEAICRIERSAFDFNLAIRQRFLMRAMLPQSERVGSWSYHAQNMLRDARMWKRCFARTWRRIPGRLHTASRACQRAFSNSQL